MKHLVLVLSVILGSVASSSSSMAELDRSGQLPEAQDIRSADTGSPVPPQLRKVSVKAAITKIEITVDPATGPVFRHTEVCRIETEVPLHDVSAPFRGLIPNYEILSCPSEALGSTNELKLLVDASSRNSDNHAFPIPEGRVVRHFGAYLAGASGHPVDAPAPWVGNRVFTLDVGPTEVGFEVDPELDLTCNGEGRDKACYPSQPVYYSATVLFEDQGE